MFKDRSWLVPSQLILDNKNPTRADAGWGFLFGYFRFAVSTDLPSAHDAKEARFIRCRFRRRRRIMIAPETLSLALKTLHRLIIYARAKAYDGDARGAADFLDGFELLPEYLADDLDRSEDIA